MQKFKTAQSVGKVMTTVFFLLDFAPAWSTINAAAYQKSLKRNQRFECTEDAQIEAKNWLRSQDAIFFYEGLNNLIYQYDKCLNKHGDYVEK